MATDQSTIYEAREAFSRSDFATAFDKAGIALARTPGSAEALLLRINSAIQLERWSDAIAGLESLISQQPGQAKLSRILSTCWLRIGNQRKVERDFPAAGDAYRRALMACADNHDAAFNLALVLLDNKQTSDAIGLLTRIIEHNKDDVEATLKLAEAEIAVGDRDSAINRLTLIADKSVQHAHLQRACRLLLEACPPDQAKSIARRVIQRDRKTGWAREFSRQLRKDNDLDGSREILALARTRTQDAAELLRLDLAEALGLPSSYADQHQLETRRDDFLRRLENFVDNYPVSRIRAIAPSPDALLWDNFYLAYQGENDYSPQCRFGDWLSASLQALLSIDPGSRRHRQKHRIALVSSRFHDCTVGSYFGSWIKYLTDHGWETILVHVGNYRDELSAELRSHAHAELSLDGSVAENARALQELEADILLYPELGMDRRTLALAALRLAPLQACAWGHPVTSGLPTIDAFFSCADMEPEHAQQQYRERLMLLPGLGTRYLSPDIPERESRSSLGLPEAATLYLIPQSLFKLHPDNDRVYADILKADPDAVMVFFRGIESGTLRTFQRRLGNVCAQAGVAQDRRVMFLPIRPRAEYLRINLACDVMLDSLRWSGGNTSLDALHTGLPVVTHPGHFMRSRQSMAMLRHLGHDDLIAASTAELASLAMETAHDKSLKRAFGDRIRSDLRALTHSELPLEALDAALRRLVAEKRNVM